MKKEEIKKLMEKSYRQPSITFGSGGHGLESPTGGDKNNKVEIKMKDSGDFAAFHNGDEVGTISKGSFLSFVTSCFEKEDEEEDIMEDIKEDKKELKPKVSE